MRTFAEQQRSSQRPAFAPDAARDTHPTLNEQNPSGNQALQPLRIAASSLADRPRADAAAPFGHDFRRIPVYPESCDSLTSDRVNSGALGVASADNASPASPWAHATSSSAAPLLLQRDPDDAKGGSGGASPKTPMNAAAPPLEPTWSITSSAEPFPGDPVPGYEQPKGSYTEQDRDAMKAALYARERANNKNTVEFLGDYGSALVDLWATHATEVMAKTAEEAGWSRFGKMLSWVVRESLIALSGVGAAVKLGHLGVELVKLATSAVGEIAAEAIENPEADVEATRAEIDAKTKQVADLLMAQADNLAGMYSPVAPYAFWLGQLDPRDLSELSRFRIPPAFERPPTGMVRASVAQAIVALLNDDVWVFATKQEDALYGIFGHYDVPADNVIVMRLAVHADGSTSAATANLSTSETLAKEISGRPVAQMPNVPLHITLASSENPAEAVRAALNGTELSLRQTLQPTPAIIGDVPGVLTPMDASDAIVQAYPSRSPAEITRDASGEIRINGGGLLEHLYLYRWLNPGEDLGWIIAQIEEQRVSQEREEAERDDAVVIGPKLAGQSEMLSPEKLAQQIHNHLTASEKPSAEDLLRSDIVGLTPVSARHE